MENSKIRYQFNRLPMVLFIACLAITVVAGSVAEMIHHEEKEK